MTISYMKSVIKKKYGDYIKGQAVDRMHDYQILAIYTRIVNSNRRAN